MPDTTARVRAKGLDATGVTEALAERLWGRAHGGQPGEYLVALVELQAVEPHGPSVDGKKRIDLVLTIVEPAMDKATEDTVRELMRAMVSQRRIEEGEIPLDGTTLDLETARTGAIARIERDEDGRPVGVWNGDPDDGPSQVTPCPSPGCVLPEEHDGEHSVVFDKAGDPATVK